MRPLYAVLACAVAWGPLAAAAMPAVAQVESGNRAEAVSEKPDGVTVVVYRDNPVDSATLREFSNRNWSQVSGRGLALIVEKRVVDIPAGEGIVRFKGLATGIVPHSATIDGLPADLLEQNADYDLITPHDLIERSVGQTVGVVRTNAANGDIIEEQGVLRAGTNGAVVEINGRYEALDCSGLTERLVFNSVPEGLGATPTLSIKTRAEQAGRHEITLAYLATGLEWSADYVARVSGDQSTINLEGWITLANFGGTSFADAPVIVVAGDLARDEDTRPVQLRMRYSMVDCWPQMRTDETGIPPTYKEDRREYDGPPVIVPGPPSPSMAMREAASEIVVTGQRVKARQEDLGDYKAYVLPHLTTVAARQTKQVLFLAQDDIAVERVLVASFVPTDDTVQSQATMIELRAKNEEAVGLGLPVPEGNVAFYIATDEQPTAYAGGDTLSDTPVGLPVRLKFQQNDLVTSKVLATGSDTRGSGARRRQVESYRVTLGNASEQAVEIEMPLDIWQTGAPGFRMEREGLRSRIDSDTGLRVWRTRLEAGQERTFDARWSYDAPSRL